MDLKLFDGFYREYFNTEDAKLEDLPEFTRLIYEKLVNWQKSIIEEKKWILLSSILSEEERKYTSCDWLNLDYKCDELTEIKCIMHFAVLKDNMYLLDFVDKNIKKVNNTDINGIIHRSAVFCNNIELAKKYKGYSYEFILFVHSVLNEHLEALKYLFECCPMINININTRLLILAATTKNLDIIRICAKFDINSPNRLQAVYYNLFENIRDKIDEIIPDWYIKLNGYLEDILNYNIHQSLSIESFTSTIDYAIENKCNLNFSNVLLALHHFPPLSDVKLLQDKIYFILGKNLNLSVTNLLYSLLRHKMVDIDLFNILVNHGEFGISTFLNIISEYVYLTPEMIDKLIEKGIFTTHYKFVRIIIDDLNLVKYVVEKYSDKLDIPLLFQYVCKFDYFEYAKYLYEKFHISGFVIKRTYLAIYEHLLKIYATDHIEILTWLNEIIQKNKILGI
jgi:hypothetical protein